MADGAGLLLFLDSETQAKLAPYATEDPAELHITVGVLDEPAGQLATQDWSALADVVSGLAERFAPLAGVISGPGTFQSAPDQEVHVALVDVPGLSELRGEFIAAAQAAGLTVASDHGYTPHITLGYGPTPGAQNVPSLPLRLSALTLVWGDERSVYPLSGSKVLRFAHPPEIRAKAKQALEEHGSFRKAAKATGIPHQTIHHWATHGGFDDLEAAQSAQADPVDTVLRPAAEEGKEPDQAVTVNVEPDEPTGYPESPMDGTAEVATVPPPFEDATPDLDSVQVDIGHGVQGWVPDSPYALQALLRYTNALLSGARPDRALAAANVIDPDFGLTEAQNASLMESLSTLMMAEGHAYVLRFAANPPDYVRSVYDQFAMSDGDISQLADHITQLATEAYTQAVNDQLAGLGRDPVDSITDEKVLAKIEQQAEDTARQVAETYNRDLATATGSSWIDLSAERGNQMSRQWLEDDINGWVGDRADWKSAQVASDTACSAYNDAVAEWQSQNGTIDEARLSPDDAVCEDCQEALDDLGDWMPADDFFADPRSSGYLHSGCPHYAETRQADVSEDTELWTGQGTESDAAATA